MQDEARFTPANTMFNGDDVRLLQERLLTRAKLLEAAKESTVVTSDHSLAEAARRAGLPVRGD